MNEIRLTDLFLTSEPLNHTTRIPRPVSRIRIPHPYPASVSRIRIPHPYPASVSRIRIPHPYPTSVSLASPGDTVYLRGGTYTFDGKGATSLIGVSVTKSGKSATERICFFAYRDELPVLDFSELTLGTGIGAGIRVQGEWLHFKGMEICNVKAPSGANNGIWCNPCSNNIFEKIDFHHNEGPGLSIANGKGGLMILNCDSHDNYDKAKRG